MKLGTVIREHKKLAEECMELALIITQQLNKPKMDFEDDIIDEMPGSTPAEISAVFKRRTGGLKPKDPDLGDKLKDVPDDIPDMAKGGVLSPQMQDFLENYSDQMTFEQYLQMMAMRAKKANGGLSYLLRL